jgi:hypothetical protein
MPILIGGTRSGLTEISVPKVTQITDFLVKEVLEESTSHRPTMSINRLILSTEDFADIQGQ